MNSLRSELQISKYLQHSTKRNKFWKESYTIVYKQTFGNNRSGGKINFMVCYSVPALKECLMLFLEAIPATRTDGSWNSWEF